MHGAGYTHPCREQEAKVFGENGGDDETRTRDLCRDSSSPEKKSDESK